VRDLHPLINRKSAHGWVYPACSSYNCNIAFASWPLMNKRRIPVYHHGGTRPDAFRGSDKAFHLAMCGFCFSFKSCVEAQGKLTTRSFGLVKQRGNSHETAFHRFLVSRSADLSPLDHVRGDSLRSLARAIASRVLGVSEKSYLLVLLDHLICVARGPLSGLRCASYSQDRAI
jgi:hypothetical protein